MGKTGPGELNWVGGQEWKAGELHARRGGNSEPNLPFKEEIDEGAA